MRNQAEVACGISIAEGCKSRGKSYESGNQTACVVAEPAVGVEHHVAAVAHQAHVHVQPRAGLAVGDFRGERNVQVESRCEIADYPFGEH